MLWTFLILAIILSANYDFCVSITTYTCGRHLTTKRYFSVNTCTRRLKRRRRRRGTRRRRSDAEWRFLEDYCRISAQRTGINHINRFCCSISGFSVIRWLVSWYNIWPFATRNICPKPYKICQSKLQLLANSKSFNNIYQCGEFSPDLVTLSGSQWQKQTFG